MRPTYRIVIACSFLVLSFEILLTRVFSVRLSYHYASLIISLSMIGLVIGALSVFFMRKRANLRNLSSPEALSYIAAALAVSCPLVFISSAITPFDHVKMLWENIQVAYLVCFVIQCTIPFFLYGMLISTVLSIWPQRANRIYAFDLFGGALGLVAAMVLMDVWRMEFVLLAVTALAGLAILPALKGKFASVVFGSGLLALCVVIGAETISLPISPYKGLMQALNADGARHVETIYSSHSRLDIFENPSMRSAPGMSVVFQGHVPKGRGLAIDGHIVGVHIDGSNGRTHEFLRHLPSSLPYLFSGPQDILIIGARNGIDLLQAARFSPRHLYVAESDTSVLRYVKRQNARSPVPVTIFPGSGRMVLRNLPHRLGLIFLSTTGFTPSGNFGLHEDYDLTVEALIQYLRALRDDGLLFIQMFLLPPPRLELRLAHNMAAAMEGLRIGKTGKHLLVYRSWDTVNFLVKRNGFSEGDVDIIDNFLLNRQFDRIYPAGSEKNPFILGVDYATLFRNILDPGLASGFTESYVFDIRPTTDDRPFFYYFLKINRLAEIYELGGRKWQYFLHEGMALPFIIVVLALVALAIFIITFFSVGRFKENFQKDSPKRTPGFFLYFALIGFAFMFVEVFFIHRLILPFGSPVRAFSITLVTMLAATGVGSMVSGSIPGTTRLQIMGLAPLLCGACYFLFNMIAETRLSALATVPIAGILGFFFPVGLSFFVQDQGTDIPLAYATNGAASVVSPPIASLLGTSYGCGILLVLAAVLYTLAVALVSPLVLRTIRSTEKP